uniref:Retroviral polymerase SH3-like domain-containing protein n=1 Tax=Tanacetum cinerariifolium TaxID=118510 RepID=A0A6L2NGP4_TANCI|nr:hypothetical protein [Tanacetum cinerariifolium]
MDSIISLGQKNTLAEYMILFDADNHPPMLDKDLFDSWKSRMELYMQNREHRRMILESVEHGPLIWPTVEENGLHADIYSLANHHKVAKDLWEIVYLNSLPPEWSNFVIDSHMYHQTSTVPQVIPQVAYQSPQAPTQLMIKSSFVDSGFAAPAFSPWDDPIACFNKAMAFLTAVASSRGILQVDKQGLLNATTVKEKAMLAEAQEAGQILNEEQLAFLTDPGIPAGQAQTIIPHNAAFQTKDLDTYDSDCDDLSNAQAVLMDNISNYGSNVILEISESCETCLNLNAEFSKSKQAYNDLLNKIFKKNDLKAQLKDKDTTICKLKDTIKSLRKDNKEEIVDNDRFGESSPNPTTSNLKRRNRRRSKQPFYLEESPLDMMADQRTMAELLCAHTEGYAEAIVVSSILAERFELKHSLINMMTLDQLFGLEKDNPHDHIPNQDSLNSAAGGNLLERRTQDVLTIIKNRSKVRNSRNKSIVSQVKSNKSIVSQVKSSDVNYSSSSEIAKLTHVVNQQTSAVTAAMTAILKLFQATSPPASVKAIEEIYDNIQGYVSAAAVNYNQGNSSYRPSSVANQIRPLGFAQPNVQNNQNWFSQPQGYNRGNNFNKDTSYQAPIQKNQVVPLNIGIFVGYAPTKKAFRIYNRRTQIITETIHVTFDELTAMASEQFSSRPRIQVMTPVTPSTKLVSNPGSQQPCIPPNRDDWDRLFQLMFDEYFNPPTITVSPVQQAVASRAKVSAGSHVSISISQDAPSISIPLSQAQEHSPIISLGFKESPKTPTFHDDPLNESAQDSPSQGSSYNVIQIYTLFEHLGRWTKDRPIENVIGDPFRFVSIRKQLEIIPCGVILMPSSIQ